MLLNGRRDKINTVQPGRNQNPPRRHGGTEKHGENHNFACNAREIGFTRTLEKIQRHTTKNTEKKQRSRRNMSKGLEARCSITMLPMSLQQTRFRHVLTYACILFCFVQSSQSDTRPLPQDTGAVHLYQLLLKLKTTARIMHTTAHPDDEDGGMMTLEARGKGAAVLLFTVNRGEGGQNKFGAESSDDLGVLRTLELLQADKYYGVEQRFSRVADFGYSKTAEETFNKWHGHDIALADMVRVIRTFRPDILTSRFSGTKRDGHGHHEAAGILTQEAFRAAADPKRFPEQIKEGLLPWQAKKLYIGNVCGFGANSCPDENYTIKLNTGQIDPVLGKSYIAFALD